MNGPIGQDFNKFMTLCHVVHLFLDAPKKEML